MASNHAGEVAGGSDPADEEGAAFDLAGAGGSEDLDLVGSENGGGGEEQENMGNGRLQTLTSHLKARFQLTRKPSTSSRTACGVDHRRNNRWYQCRRQNICTLQPMNVFISTPQATAMVTRGLATPLAGTPPPPSPSPAEGAQ